MQVKQLKVELEAAGLDLKGKKSALVTRLAEHRLAAAAPPRVSTTDCDGDDEDDDAPVRVSFVRADTPSPVPPPPPLPQATPRLPPRTPAATRGGAAEPPPSALKSARRLPGAFLPAGSSTMSPGSLIGLLGAVPAPPPPPAADDAATATTDDEGASTVVGDDDEPAAEAAEALAARVGDLINNLVRALQMDGAEAGCAADEDEYVPFGE